MLQHNEPITRLNVMLKHNLRAVACPLHVEKNA